MENITNTASMPQELFASYAEAFNAADVDKIMSLYEPKAVFVYDPNAEPARGIVAIRRVMNGLFKSKSHIEIGIEKVFQAEDVALVYAAWKLTTLTPEGENKRIF